MRVQDVPVGSVFHVLNGGWRGEVFEENGKKFARVLGTPNGVVREVVEEEDYELEVTITDPSDTTFIVMAASEPYEDANAELYNADPDCTHLIESASGGSIKCLRCSGWFCY